MHFAAAIVTAAAETEHHGNPMLASLPFGLIAALVFALLALVTASYRNVSNRHADPAEAHAADLHEHETGHGH
jgi:cytochrome c biogenesis protein CcdA